MSIVETSMSWNGSMGGKYWGLVRKIGPWKTTPADQRRANSRAGGPHAGHGNWFQSWEPHPYIQTKPSSKLQDEYITKDVVTKSKEYGSKKGVVGNRSRKFIANEWVGRLKYNNDKQVPSFGAFGSGTQIYNEKSIIDGKLNLDDRPDSILYKTEIPQEKYSSKPNIRNNIKPQLYEDYKPKTKREIDETSTSPSGTTAENLGRRRTDLV